MINYLGQFLEVVVEEDFVDSIPTHVHLNVRVLIEVDAGRLVGFLLEAGIGKLR